VDVLYVQKWPWAGGGEWWKYRNRRNLKIKEFKAVEKYATSVKAVSPICGRGTSVKYKDCNSENVMLLGVNELYPEVVGISMYLGRFFSQSEAEGGRPFCVVGFDIAEKLFVNETPLGKTIKVGSVNFRVVGVIEKRGSLLGLESLDNQIFVPIRAFFRRFGSNRGIAIVVKVADIQKLEDTKEELRGILRKVRLVPPGVEDDFSINQQDMLIQKFNNIGIVIAGIGLLITALSLFVGAIGIMNIMFVSVTERTKEIGIRKAIGAKRGTILLQFLIETAVLSFMGGIIGVGISYPLSLLLNQVLPTTMPVGVVAIALAISILVGVVSGFLPAFRASQLNPVETLRYE
jgi:putative ABC transport system permease protein